jgi:lipopolysaccharide/colanic/teichoic acid biosynthesis glycosyltransferase
MQSAAKQSLDFILAAFGTVALSPLLVIIGILVKLDSRGPVLFQGERLAQGGGTFKMYKFRTMVHVENPAEPDRVASGTNDSRITRLGAHLRRFKLDELPQLINVVRGEMSLVGPRPEGTRYAKHYTGELQRVLSVRPGITGVAQLEYIEESALLGAAEDYETIYIERILPQKLALDLWYVDNWSLALDVRLILCTTVRVLAIAKTRAPARICRHKGGLHD